MSSDLPKVRHGLEALPVEHSGRRMVLLRDRLGYCDDSLIISPQLATLLAQMNGQNSLRDLQAYYMRMTGEMLFTEQLQGILDKLDEHLFLENERFLHAAMEAVAHFQRDPVKRMQFAGKSYPENSDSLRQQLELYFRGESPDQPESNARSHEQGGRKRLLGLVAPHIDIQAGGECFALAYKAAGEAISPESWIVLGTGHEPVDNYFALTCKDFETPLGTIHHDRECCSLLQRLSPRDVMASEYNHQREHSVEFQAVFLAYTQPRARIVPILCSFSPEDWESDRPYIDEMAEILRKLPLLVGRPVGIIASVDLAHIGPRYGDAFKPHAGTVTEHLSADRNLLESLERCDAASFMEKLRRERNRRRICGAASLYMLARVMEGRGHGVLLQHTHATVDHVNSFVTFASMAFYEMEYHSKSGGKATT